MECLWSGEETGFGFGDYLGGLMREGEGGYGDVEGAHDGEETDEVEGV